MAEKIDPALFNLPVHEIRCGYRTAVYFWRTKRILEQDRNDAQITHQVFQKQDNVTLCGTQEATAILKYGTGFYKNYNEAVTLFARYQQCQRNLNHAVFDRDRNQQNELLSELHEVSVKLDELWVDKFSEIEVYSLSDGDDLSASETAMLIEGNYSFFAHLESLYLGVLARRTKLATNAKVVVEAASGKPVLFFTDRFDHFAMQDGDGYAAKIGGISGVACDSMASWYGGKGMGTIPHAMIVAYGGDSVLAVEKFNQYFPEVNTISLVDFDNDSVNTALQVAGRLGDKLWGVRLDTAENLTDVSLQKLDDYRRDEKPGVAPVLVEKVRKALDDAGHSHVKIIVSGGFNPERIAKFEELGTPVDVYAVGSWMLSGKFDFTADAVRLNGKNLAKTGRQYRPNPRLNRTL